MTEELQSLLDRIEQDGVEQANAKAAQIDEAAREQAARIVADAERRAAQARTTAEHEAALFAERGRVALEQAARDVVITVEQNLIALLESMLTETVGEVLSGEGLERLVATAIETYLKEGEPRLEVAPGDQDRILALVKAKYREAAGSGVEVASNSELVGGFRVTLRGKSVTHDFSREAIAEAFCKLLRPRLADILRASLNNKTAQDAEQR